MSLSIPDHLEVAMRICISLILTYILTLGSFPQVVPQSQLVVIGSVASAFTMVLPTLLFSIGAVVFPGMVMSVCMALVISTILLAVAATGGVHAYIGIYFIVALILSGLRFSKAGASSALLLMFVSLNTMGMSSVAEEKGLAFVASLWTESGVTNPNAVFRNTLIGMCWTCLCISFARLVPPLRTVRSAHSRKLLPKVLKDVAAFIRLTMEHHIVDDVNDVNDDDDFQDDATDSVTLESPLISSSADRVDEKPEDMEDIIVKVIHNASITITPGLAELTVLEPRLIRAICECRPPYNLVNLLSGLTNAINDLIFSSLTLRAFSKAGFQELQVGGLKELYEESAEILDNTADSLATLTHSEIVTKASTEDPDNRLPTAFDPIRLTTRAVGVQNMANDFIDAMNNTDPPNQGTRSFFDKSARAAYMKYSKPWISGVGFGLLSAICGCFIKAFTPMTWKRIFLPPYYDLPKFIWCVKFAVGFTVLVSMQVYWPAFANLEVPTRDDVQSAHFSGWYLIAYAFSTTQTVEGTWKKSILRMLGTIGGGLCAWIGLTACGNSPVGLGAWLTVSNTVVAYYGLPKGFSSRFGLNPDLAWGPAYFSMTQALVVLEVFWGYGEKNDITLNRIVANLVGIAMSMALALVPPGIYGNSPREMKFLLEDKKRAFRDCIKLVLDGSDMAGLHHLHATSRATFIAGYNEANENYKDADKLEKMCIFKPNPQMKVGLENMAVLGSSILSLIRFAIILIEVEPEGGDRFGDGSEERCILEAILSGLDIEDDAHNISSYQTHHQKGDGKNHERPNILCDTLNQAERAVPAHTTFAHLCIFICHYIMHREIKLDTVRWGVLGKQQTSNGKRTMFHGTPLQFPNHCN